MFPNLRVEMYGETSTWEHWWLEQEHTEQRHYFLGKDNVPFHTVIWPAILMGLNHMHAVEKLLMNQYNCLLPRLTTKTMFQQWNTLCLQEVSFQNLGNMLFGYLRSLERFDPDTLRYYLEYQYARIPRYRLYMGGIC